MGITWQYRGDILRISWTYLGDIMAYLGHILGIYWAYLEMSISWAYIGHYWVYLLSMGHMAHIGPCGHIFTFADLSRI